MCVGLELTLLSENEYERLSSGDMTPAMAARYLQEGEFRLRGFDEVLRTCTRSRTCSRGSRRRCWRRSRAPTRRVSRAPSGTG